MQNYMHHYVFNFLGHCFSWFYNHSFGSNSNNFCFNEVVNFFENNFNTYRFLKVFGHLNIFNVHYIRNKSFGLEPRVYYPSFNQFLDFYDFS